MTLNNIIRSERSQMRKTTYGLILFIWMSAKDKLIEIESKLVTIWGER